MMRREKILAGMARQAMKAREGDFDTEDPVQLFFAFLETVEQTLALIRPMLHSYHEAWSEGRFEDADALRQQIFTTCNGTAVAAMCMTVFYPGLPDVEIPPQLKELWGEGEVKH